ncbi:hypothetical protein AB0L41_42230 [Amycolatopsis mediterranei]|uniref:hypothetical protein n=1 Tax=Amycolatopsis mediterranei TaxID=33910 RepID=UPI0034244D29
MDLTAVSFCSARALDLLGAQAKHAHRTGVKSALVARQRVILRPLALRGLERTIPGRYPP